jgi:starvation-inducible DNA-binding protein
MTDYLKKNDQSEIAETLHKVLNNTFGLYMKTHAYHWNVEGPNFKSLHEMFEDQYTDMWNAMDVIAERMRALGVYAPHNVSEMTKFNTVPEAKAGEVDAIQMAKELAEGNAIVSKILADCIEKATELGDESTGDLFVERQRQHDLNAWMLNSMAK